MATEMAEQPGVLAALASRRDEIVERVRTLLPASLHGVVLIARGSSDHAAIYGRYVIELASGRPVALGAPSLHTLYGARIDYRGYLAIGVSQSGRTPEIVTVLEKARAAGARTVAVTNVAESALGETAELVLTLGAGEERAIPATKTFTAQLAVFAMLAEALGPVSWDASDWSRVPEVVAGVLDDTQPAVMVAESLDEVTGLITVGRGFLFASALETALKLKEITGILAMGYSAADLLHGPIAVVERGLPVLALVARGPARPAMDEVQAALRDRGARVFVVGEDPKADLPVPPVLPEPMVPIPLAVRAQQLAHATALVRGLDPDAPSGLRKVTPTR